MPSCLSNILSAIPAFALLAQVATAGEVHRDLALPSDALDGEIRYNIYLPDAIKDGDRLPVVYLLHGFGGSLNEWLNGGHSEQALDRMIGSGEIGPLIAVMPDAGKGWYVDSAAYGGPGNYETAIYRDLVAGIDREYPTLADPGQRCIAGDSMGGHGALRLAFTHPDVFETVAALSPGIWKPDGVSWSTGPAIETAEYREKRFPRTTGEIFDMDVLNAQSPFSLVPGLRDRAPSLRVLLATGDDDALSLQDGTLEMYLDLRSAGLKPELRVGDGGHNWSYWRQVVPDVFSFCDLGFRDNRQG